MKHDQAFRTLLRDFGYIFRDGAIIQKGVYPFTLDSLWRYASSAMAACEMLCPIIKEKEFTDRLVKLWHRNDMAA